MEALERTVRIWAVGSGKEEDLDSVVSDIAAGKISLLEVVKSLAPYLTSEEDEQRAKGVDFLSSVVSRCAPKTFNTRSTQVLTNFFCDKLNDPEVIKPSLIGLQALSAIPSFLPDNATATLRAIFSQPVIKTSPVTVRFIALNIIDSLVARHRETLKEINDEFITGFLNLVDGEKDPRDLLLIFAMERVILLEFDVSKFTERMFELICCYFPISFRPPPNDPYGITTEDLSSSLRSVDISSLIPVTSPANLTFGDLAPLSSCLSSTPAFGPPAIPFFLDKLNTGSPAAKKDTLVALAACFPVYGAAMCRSSARKLWSSLKLEIFQPTDSLTEVEALKTVQILIQTIYSSQGEEESKEDMQGLAKDACQECLDILREPEKSMAKPAMKVLCAFMSTTPLVATYTITRTVPHMVALFRNPDEATTRPSILLLLADLTNAAKDAVTRSSPSANAEAPTEVPISPYKDDILAVGTFGLKATESRKAAVSVLKALATTQDACTAEEITFIVINLNGHIQPEPNATEDCSDSILDLLSTIAESNSKPVEEQTLPLLFTELPDSPDLLSTASQRNTCFLTLGALTQLCQHPDLFAPFTIRLTTKLDLICVPSSPPQSQSDAASYAYSILAALAKTLEAKLEKKHTDVGKYLDGLAWRLVNLFVHSALSEKEHVRFLSENERLVAMACSIITSVVQVLPLQQQQTFSTAYFHLFVDGDLSFAGKGQHKDFGASRFAPLQTGIPAQSNLLALFKAGIIALRQDLSTLPVPDLSAFLITVTEWSQGDSLTEFQRTAAWQLAASVTNKHADELAPYLTYILDNFWPNEVVDASQTPQRRSSGIRCCTWICKALEIRVHPVLQQFTDRFIACFTDDALSLDAAVGLGHFTATESVLSKSNHAVIKILHAQRFFNGILERLLKGATDLENVATQSPYLVALTCLLRTVPKATYIDKLPSLLPLLLRGLMLPGSDTKANVIDTLLVVAEDDSIRQSAIAGHVSTLLKSMLSILEMQDASSRVKVSALKYMKIIPELVRYELLHPHKQGVIKSLGGALDDPNKKVRREAVDARDRWFRCRGR